MTHNDKGLATTAIHAHQKPNELHGAVIPGIEMSTIFAQKSPTEKYSEYSYARNNNPTRDTMEKLIAATEGGKYGISFGSGSGAISGILQALAPNQNIICGQSVCD